MSLVASISDAVNIREDGLRLLISILAGYPISAIYRTFIYNKSPLFQHSFLAIVGVILYIFNCGIAIYHSLFSILVAYILTNHFPASGLQVALAHTCFLGHLLIGYWYAESTRYDITWTTPFCIMTLRFTGLVMDVYDGQQKKESLKPDQLKTAIKNPPGLLEIAAFGFFYGGTFVGPQFTLSRFRSFINGEYLDKNGEIRSSSIMASMTRFVAGVFFAVLHKWGTLWVPDEYFNSRDFYNTPFFWKVFWNTVWFKATMYRYVTAWLLTEGTVILCGLAYNGIDSETGEDRWDGCRDIHINKFELGSDYTSCVESFNCGTNTFAKNHIFRRLKFLGNKYYSHLLTLFYLAIWHGYHLGYFILFAYEFACVVSQEQLYSLIKRSPKFQEFLSQSFVRPFIWLFGRIVISISMAFAFFSFGLVKKEVWIGPLSSMYFYGHIFYFVIWPLTNAVLQKIIPREKKSKTT